MILAGYLFGTALVAQVNPSSEYVSGYFKADGTYVEGHYRTTPNSTVNDNYSTYPNVNPWTGQQGTRGRQQVTYTTPVATFNLFGNGRVRHIESTMPTNQPTQYEPLPTGYWAVDAFGNSVWVPY